MRNPTPPGQQKPPPAPTALTATVTADFQVDLSWTAKTGVNFQIERAEGSGPFAWLATITKLSFTDSNAERGKSYSYRVKASNAYGSSPYSNVVSASIPALPPPPKPVFTCKNGMATEGTKLLSKIADVTPPPPPPPATT